MMITLELPPEIERLLREEAAATGKTATDIIARALSEHFLARVATTSRGYSPGEKAPQSGSWGRAGEAFGPEGGPVGEAVALDDDTSSAEGARPAVIITNATRLAQLLQEADITQALALEEDDGRRHIFLDGRRTAWIGATNIKVVEVVLDMIAWNVSPKDIHEQYPELSLAQIHAALAYYYDHQDALDAEIAATERFADQLREEAGETPFVKRMRAAGKIS